MAQKKQWAPLIGAPLYHLLHVLPYPLHRLDHILAMAPKADINSVPSRLHGLISTVVPFGATLPISSISSSVTAIHPCVQSISA